MEDQPSHSLGLYAGGHRENEMSPLMHPSVVQLWQSYLAAVGGNAPLEPPSIWHFCDNEREADTLAALVVRGAKRATSPSLWFFESRGDPLPQSGDVHVVTNWAGEAQCIIRTTEVTVTPFNEVSAEHAAAEGEGDGSLAYWRQVHWDYYHRELAGTEYVPRGDMPVVCERFEVLCLSPAAQEADAGDDSAP